MESIKKKNNIRHKGLSYSYSYFSILFSYHQTIAKPTSPNYRMKSLHTITPRKETIVQFSKFALVGVLNTAISLAVFYLLYNLFSINYPIANLVSYIIGVINSFFWNKLWVFRRGSGNMVRESLIFLLVFAVCYSIQYISLWGMVEVAGINPNWAQLPAMAVYTIVNYLLNRYVTFKK